VSSSATICRPGRDRTGHATLRSTILDVLAGSSRAAEAPPPLLDPLSDAEHAERDLLRRREDAFGG
jgi:hypothetical protein